MKLNYLRSGLLLATLMIPCADNSFAQGSQVQVSANKEIKVSISADGSFRLNLQSRQYGQTDMERMLSSILDLSGDCTFVKGKSKTDFNGTTHTSFAQYYKGVKVENGIVLVHTQKGFVTSVNGNILQEPKEQLSLSPSIGADKALEIAQKEMDIVKTINHYDPELVIYKQANEPVLAYKTRVDGVSKKGVVLMYNVFIDAIHGKVIRKISLIAHADVQGSGQTYYSGVREMTVDSFSGGYRLRDNGRKIETYNVKGQSFNQSAAPAFNNPNDVVNSIPVWGQQLTLKSTTLQSPADPSRYTNLFNGPVSLNGWLIRSQVEKLATAPSTFMTVKDGLLDPPMNTGIVNLPVTDMLDLSVDASIYRGAFSKDSVLVDIGAGGLTYTVLSSDTNKIRYTMDNLTPGTHIWTNTSGDSGTYVIALAANPAVDVHWGMQKTYDFYKTTFNYYSYNNDSNAVIRNYYDATNQIMQTQNNAMALPAPHFAMAFGTGDGTLMNPVVALDIEGHEFTHLVNSSNANLEYSGESGALNESFSDMMGAAIVYYGKGADSLTWNLGEHVMVSAPYMRSMSNPKGPASFTDGRPQPNTYKGEHWAETANPSQQNDNGGVHVNSGVGNKWFYLLAHGGSGTNDNNYSYNIAPIGIDKAQKIAFSTFTDYLTATSKYLDAYQESLEATTALYGQNSTEYQTVKEAWKAVGIPKDSATGINDHSIQANGLEFYPNPSNGEFNIQSSLTSSTNIELYSIVGIKVMEAKIKPGINKLNIMTLSKGIYLVKYSVDGQTYARKIIYK